MTKLLFGKQKNMNESLTLTTVLLDKCLQSGSPFICIISICKISFFPHFQLGNVI